MLRSYNFLYYYLEIRIENLYFPIGITRLLPPFPLLRRAEPPLCVTIQEQKSISKEKKQQQNQKKLFVKCRIGGFIKEPAYYDHKIGSEVAFPSWPPHQGYGPTGSLYKQTLEQGVSSRASLPTFRASLVNGVMVIWLPSQHDGLHVDKNCSSKLHKGLWFRGEINNSATVINTGRQQSSVNGIGVKTYTPIWILLNISFYPRNNYILHLNGYVT